MKKSIFTLIPSTRENSEQYPQIVKESIQVFECIWDDAIEYKANESEYHFVLRIEKIIMQEHWFEALEEGSKFPPLPVDYGFRESIHFWFSEFSSPYAVNVPQDRETNASQIQFIANRIDPEIHWELEACAKLKKVPKVFLQKALKGIVKEAKERHITTITPSFMDEINDQSKDKY